MDAIGCAASAMTAGLMALANGECQPSGSKREDSPRACRSHPGRRRPRCDRKRGQALLLSRVIPRLSGGLDTRLAFRHAMGTRGPMTRHGYLPHRSRCSRQLSCVLRGMPRSRTLSQAFLINQPDGNRDKIVTGIESQHPMNGIWFRLAHGSPRRQDTTSGRR